MASLKWEPSTVKSYLRLTSQNLGQIQAKLDSQGNITRKDIATLLHQGNVGLARAKAQKLINEDAFGDLLEVLEMELGVLLEHFPELDENLVPTPVLAEATSSIIYAAPYVHCKELDIVRNTLIQRFGSDFARSAIGNREHHVSPRIVKAIAAPSPSAAMLDMYLQNVAHSYGVQWSREPQRQEIVNLLSEILNPTASPEIDLAQLRKFCSHGLPDEPSWLRPRIWKLFLGTLPTKQASWKTEITKQRDCYYDLVRRLLEPYASPPAPTNPLSLSDDALLSVFRQLSRIPRQLFSHLEEAPEAFDQNPLLHDADNKIKIPSALALDERLKLLLDHDCGKVDANAAPEIRLEIDNESMPEISLSNFDSASEGRNNTSETLVESRVYSFGNAHPQHCSAILRMLFIHTSVNPGNLSPNIPSLLIPLYTALQSEVEPEELAHVEADTFWLFEALVAEFSELEEDEGVQRWMNKFNDRLALADAELYENLQSNGLHPALPHYSYRWLGPLLAHTLPIPAIYLIWDGLFSRPARERNDNPKLEFLVDVTTAMLVAVRGELLRLGQSQAQSNSLWVDENWRIVPSTRQKIVTGDAFLDGISVLQAYPHGSIGSVERILQTAFDLGNQRQAIASSLPNPTSMTLGARLKATMWRGFTNQMDDAEASPEHSDEASDIGNQNQPEDGNLPNTPNQTASPNLTSQIANSMWRGIRGQSMADPPSNVASNVLPAQSRSSFSPPDEMGYLPTGDNRNTGSIWGYAEKLKDSDTVATLAKVSTNWRAKALLGSWGRNSTQDVNNGPAAPTSGAAPAGSNGRASLGFGENRDPFSGSDQHELNSPPSQTSYRPHRDSSASYSSSSSSFSPTSPERSGGNGSLVRKTKNLFLSKSPPPSSRSAPKPLLLNSATPITSKSDGHIRSGSNFSAPDLEEWADVMKVKKRYLHRDSRSSISSLSPSDALKSSRSDWESDTAGSSRVVPLNRRSVSPMAPSYRVGRNRPTSRTSSTASEPFSPSSLSNTILSPNQKPIHSAPAYTTSHVSSPVLVSPSSSILLAPPSDANPILLQHAHSDNSDSTPHESFSSPKLFRRKPDLARAEGDESNSSFASSAPTRNPRVRSKRYPQRPANLQIRENAHKPRTVIERKAPSPTNANLTVDWPADDLDVVSTPRATNFELNGYDAAPPVSPRAISPRSRHPRKVSTDNKERFRKSSTERRDGQLRKASIGPRPRKISSESRDVTRRQRDSSAEEGDDEGYDELLSAYESEEGSQGISLQ